MSNLIVFIMFILSQVDFEARDNKQLEKPLKQQVKIRNIILCQLGFSEGNFNVPSEKVSSSHHYNEEMQGITLRYFSACTFNGLLINQDGAKCLWVRS